MYEYNYIFQRHLTKYLMSFDITVFFVHLEANTFFSGLKYSDP